MKRDVSPTRVAVVANGDATRESRLRKALDAATGLCCAGVLVPGPDLPDRLEALGAQVVLTHVGPSNGAALEAVGRISRALPEVHILAIAPNGDYANIAAAFRAGASGYLLETCSLEEVREAVRGVCQGGAPMSAQVARRVVEAFRPPRSEATVALTQREVQVLELVVEGLVNKEIADRLSISIETVRHHLKQIYAKLRVGTRTQAAMKFYQAMDGGTPLVR